MTSPLPRRGRRRAVAAGRLAALVVVLVAPVSVQAQTDVEWLGRRYGVTPPPGYYEMLRTNPQAFRFSPANGWTRRAAAVAAVRRAARSDAGGAIAAAPLARVGAEGVVAGDLRVPVFLVMYANTDETATRANLPRTTMETRLYGTQPAPPYSIHTYYRELSRDRLRVHGTVLEWTRVARNDLHYEGGCNGLCSSADVAGLIRELVQAHESALDYGAFDNDGPDGLPNSGDDDGFVDAVVVLHPEVDGACGTDNIWAHKGTYAMWTGADLVTADAAAGGGAIRVREYIIQGGQGGDTGCLANQPQAMGLVAHETGHLLGLPDLYNTNRERASEGIGWWGLMGSGNWRRPPRPAYLSAWSRSELGWATEVLVARDTVVALGPAAQSDTVLVVPLAESDELLVLENRQRLGSDAELVGPGLLVWHVDSMLVRQRRGFNGINAAPPEGVRLMQADGENDLANGLNRGDPGDPYPGILENRMLSFDTQPSTDRNDGSPTYVTIDQIHQLAPDGPMQLRVGFSHPSLITASDPLARFRLDGVVRRRFDGVFRAGTAHELAMEAVQLANDGRNRYTWESWSNGQPRTHMFTASPQGDTITAQVATEFLLEVAAAGTGSGTVTGTPALAVDGATFFSKEAGVRLVATADAGGIFEGWRGDTVATGDTLRIVMAGPRRVEAVFAAPLAVSPAPPPAAVMGAPYDHRLETEGGTDVVTWRVVGGALPPGLTLDAAGRIAGRPTASGAYPFEVEAISGSQAARRATTLDVTRPVLAVSDVVRHLVRAEFELDAADLTFLDLQGNRNGRFDVGDFLAWIDTAETAGSPEAAAAARTGAGRMAGEERRP